jgi:hypothetical protein
VNVDPDVIHENSSFLFLGAYAPDKPLSCYLTPFSFLPFSFLLAFSQSEPLARVGAPNILLDPFDWSQAQIGYQALLSEKVKTSRRRDTPGHHFHALEP